jgi:hypothetical protein
MALTVKSAADSAAKFVARAQSAGGDYSKGVSGAGDKWQSHTLSSADNYTAGVQLAISGGRFAKGVQKAGGAKYVAKASGLGAQRYPTGVGAAGPAWQQGTQPYLDTIAGLTLPPRRPRGDPGNVTGRVGMIADALHKKKLGG